MTTISKTVIRGAYEFSVSVTRELSDVVINADGDMIATEKKELISNTEIRVTKDGKYFDRGALEEFSDAYKASPSFAKSFEKFQTKPSARLGDMFLSAEATAEIAQAIADATGEVLTPEIVAFIDEKKAISEANIQAEIEYQAHVKAVENMMTLGGKSM